MSCNTQQLNITCGTDVVLHDRLIFEGETFDPNLSVGIAANLVSSLGKRTALGVMVVDDELLISVPWIDGTLPGCYGLEVTGSCNSKKWATYADSLIKYTKATRIGVSEVTVESDSYDITQEVGYCYSNSPVTFAEVTVDEGYGTPSVDVTYEQRVLSMDFHNLKGNGITDIHVDEQVGDEAVNTVTIKTDADQEGTEFQVRNGRRGNGIASSSESLSDQDGGINTFTITDDDGTVHEFHSKNGTKGSQGDSAVYDPSSPDAPDFVMANTTGDSTTKAMTQKAVTDEIDELDAKFGAVLIDGTKYSSIASTDKYINGNGKWDYSTNSNTGVTLVCTWPGKAITLYGSKSYKSKIAFLTSGKNVANTYPDYCDGETGRREVEVGATQTFTIPSDCKRIWLAVGTTNEGSESCYAPQIKIECGETLASATGIEVGVDLPSVIQDKSTVYFINSSGVWNNGANTGGFYKLWGSFSTLTVTGSTAYKSKIAFLKSKGGDSPDYCSSEVNRRELELGETKTFTVPSDCKYIWFAVGTTNDGSEIVYLPQSAKLAGNVSKNIQDHDILNESIGMKSFVRKGGKWHPANWRPRMYDYVRCGEQDAVPVGQSALSYDQFIGVFDDFVTTLPSDVAVTKTSVVRDTMNTHDIYKYVFDPGCAKNTIFLTAGMHGNEYEGYWGLLRMLEYIYSHGNANDMLGHIRHDFRIVVIPILNPYGVDNRSRYSTNTQVDQNYNFDVDWKLYTHTGSTPWQYNEPKAVKLVCDEYEEFLFHIDFHTDPYSPTKANYIEADKNSIAFADCYHKTIDERVHIRDYYSYNQITSSFVVWENSAATSFRYMEVVRGIPSIIVESAPDGYAQSGSAKMMEGVVDWYINCLCMMSSLVL